MTDPDYGTISDVNPDGGGDYTTLQAWYNATQTETAIQHARCHHSDSADLGPLLMTAAPSYNGSLDADHPLVIYAADGDEQDGSQDDSLQGAAIVTASVGAPWGIVSVAPAAVAVRGLRVTLAVGGSAPTGMIFIASAAGASVEVERTMIVSELAAGPTATMLGVQTPAAMASVAIRNNLILNKFPAHNADGIKLWALAPGADLPAAVDANSILNCAAPTSGGIGIQTSSATASVAVAARNNLVLDDGTQTGDCFLEAGIGSMSWSGSTHNASSDGTAVSVVSDFQAIVNAAIADVWADITDSDSPLAPKFGGEIDPPNGTNLWSSGVTIDAIGVDRPSNGAMFRGGLEIFRGMYHAYGGLTPAMIDYATPIASARAGTGEMDIAGLGLTGGGSHWLGVRATSAAGIEETNTDRLTRAVVDEAGQLQPLPLAAVDELTAELQADGSAIVGFTHAASPGWLAPTEFEVLTDNGTGELNLTTPAAVIAADGSGAGDYEAVVAAPSLPAMFSARARAGAEAGPVAPPVTASLPAGPAAVEEM